jgi:hypothetical protein
MSQRNNSETVLDTISDFIDERKQKNSSGAHVKSGIASKSLINFEGIVKFKVISQTIGDITVRDVNIAHSAKGFFISSKY